MSNVVHIHEFIVEYAIMDPIRGYIHDTKVVRAKDMEHAKKQLKDLVPTHLHIVSVTCVDLNLYVQTFEWPDSYI